MSIKVAINGFGRIGRNVLRAIIESGRTDIEVIAINDLGPVETNAHLLRFDSVHGRFPATVTTTEDTIDVGRGPIRVTAIRNPADLPWGDVDIVMECTGDTIDQSNSFTIQVKCRADTPNFWMSEVVTKYAKTSFHDDLGGSLYYMHPSHVKSTSLACPFTMTV